MRKIAGVSGLIAMLCLAIPGAVARTPAASKGSPATIVIVFKDGHRQSFNLSQIARVEFPASTDLTAETAPLNSSSPTRARFVGKWEVGDGSGNNFFITLDDNGDAWRSLGNVRGKWAYVNGEARVTWDDGPQDAIRKVGPRYEKFAYSAGKSFTDSPDNITSAYNTSPQPI